ncbi:MAG: DUF2752 domain-containing protein [Candidatus Hydrogenedentota bacterium]
MAAAALTLLRLFDRIAPDCPFHTILGIPCPTCGATRGVMALLDGRPLDAIAFNPLLMLGGPLLLAWLIAGLHIYARTGRFPDPAITPRRLFWGRAAALFAVGGNWIYLIAAGI